MEVDSKADVLKTQYGFRTAFENQNSEEEKTVSEDEDITSNIDDSFENGDSISDEAYNHDYENMLQ